MGEQTSIRRVAITGATGYLGTRLIERLSHEESIVSILATDIHELPSDLGPKTTFCRLDVTRPLGDIFAKYGIDALVHLAYILNPGHRRDAAYRVNVGGTRNVLQACEGTSIKRILYLSSTSVYGAHRDNPDLLTEDSPPRPLKGFQYSENKVEAEALLMEYARQHPDVTVTVLRGAPVMGPNADNFISRAFMKPVLVRASGFNPPMQFLHEDDLVEISARCILSDVPGIYNIGGTGSIKWNEMTRMIGRKVIPMPYPCLYALTGMAWVLRLQNDAPACGINFITYPWVANTEKIEKKTGMQFLTSRDAWEAYAHRITSQKAPRIKKDRNSVSRPSK